MKGFQIQQKGERRISAALRIMLVVVLLAVQIGFVVAISYFMQEYLALAYGVVQVGALFLAVHIYNEPGELSYKLIWFILLLLAPPVGMILWFLWGGAAQKRHLPRNTKRFPDEPESVRMRSEIAVDKLTRQLPDWSRTANYLCRRDFQLYQNTSVTYLPEGAILLRNLIDRAAKAERFIFLEYFILAEGKLWDELEKILCAKAREGVEVKIIFDDFGNIKRFSGETIDRLREVGVEVFIFNPVHEYVNRLHFNYRDHRKILVIDGQVGFTGGVNLADEYINHIEKYGRWKDSALMLEGEGVRSMTALFLQMWSIQRQPEFEQFLSDPIPAAANAKGFVVPYGDCPLDGERVGEMVYMDMLNRARKYVHIITPYLILDGELETALRFAAERGVDVHLILPGKPDKWFVYALAKTHYKALISSGVKISEWQPGFTHAKIVIADGVEAVAGTINLDYRSLYHHFEDAVWMVDAPCIRDIEQDFQHTLEQCRTVENTSASIWQKHYLLRATGMLLKVIAPLL